MGKRLELATKLSLIGSLVIAGCDRVITISSRPIGEVTRTPSMAPLPDSVASREPLSQAPILGDPVKETVEAMVRETLAAMPVAKTPEPKSAPTRVETALPGIIENDYDGVHFTFFRIEPLTDTLVFNNPITGEITYTSKLSNGNSAVIYFDTNLPNMGTFYDNNKMAVYQMIFSDEKGNVMITEGEAGAGIAASFSGAKDEFGSVAYSVPNPPENMNLIQFSVIPRRSFKIEKTVLYRAEGIGEQSVRKDLH